MGEDVANSRWSLSLWQLMGLVVVAALLIVASLHYPGVVVFVFVTLVPLVVVAWIATAWARFRFSQQESLLQLLALSVDRGLPASPGLRAFAELSGGRSRLLLLGLASLLDAGVPLPVALRSVPGLMSRRTRMLATTGWNLGRLSAGLTEAMRAREVERSSRMELARIAVYVGVLMLVMEAQLFFLSQFIIPKLQAISADMGTSLPPLTTAVVGMTGGLIYWIIPVGLATVVAIALVIDLATGQGGTLSRLFGIGSRRVDRPTLLRAMAVGIESGKGIGPVLEAIEPAARSRGERLRLIRARADIEKGRDWAESLAGVRLVGRADADFLRAAKATGNLPWALRMLADSKQRRGDYFRSLLARTLLPVAVLLVGSMVATIVVAFFLPLVRMIEVHVP